MNETPPKPPLATKPPMVVPPRHLSAAPPVPVPVVPATTSLRPPAVPRPAAATSIKRPKHTPVSPRISDHDEEKERVFTTKMRSGRACIMVRHVDSRTNSNQDSRKPLRNGTLVGQYLIVSLMGEGGFGLTYQAIRQTDNKIVVLKEHMPAGVAIRSEDGIFVTTATTESEAYFTSTLDEFRDEISTLVALEHPNIVRIEDFFEANGTAYYVMPLVLGTQMEVSKQAELDASKRAKDARRIRQQLLAVLDAMVYLDQNNVVHRDLKPENIQITPEGQPVILDFGSARQIRQGREYSNMYTPAFCAPEQCAPATDPKWGKLPFGQWTDMYALGACFYYRITRMLPPKAETRILAYPEDPYRPLSKRRDLQELYGEVFLNSVDRALQLEPDARWQHAQDWRAYLEQGVNANAGRKVHNILPYGTAAFFAILSLVMTVLYYGKQRELDTVSKASANFTTKLLTDVSVHISDLPGTAPLHNSFCKHLSEYLAAVEPLFSKDPALMYSVVLAYSNNALNYAEDDDFVKAGETFRLAEEKAKQLVAMAPGELDYRYNLAKIQLQYATNMFNQAEDEAAEKLTAEAISTLESICKERPQSPDYASSLIQALLLDVQIKTKRGTIPVATETMKRVDGLLEKTATAYPYHEDTLIQRAETYHLQANIELNKGHLDKAEELLKKEAAIYDGYSSDSKHHVGLLEKHPYKLSFLHKRAHVEYNLGKIHMLRAEATGSSAELDRAYWKFQDHIEQCHVLKQLDSKRPLFDYEECLSLLAQSRILIMKGELESALHRDEDLNSKTKELRDRAPSDVNVCCLHAESLCVDAAIHRRTSNPATQALAGKELEESRSFMEQTLQKANRHLLILASYVLILEESAEYALQTGDKEEAARWLNAALEKVAILKGNYPDDPRYPAMEAQLQNKLQETK